MLFWAFRLRRRAIVNRATVSAIRLLSLTHRLGDTSGAFLLRWSEPKSWATAPLNRLCGGLLSKSKALCRLPNIGYCTRIRTL